MAALPSPVTSATIICSCFFSLWKFAHQALLLVSLIGHQMLKFFSIFRLPVIPKSFRIEAHLKVLANLYMPRACISNFLVSPWKCKYHRSIIDECIISYLCFFLVNVYIHGLFLDLMPENSNNLQLLFLGLRMPSISFLQLIIVGSTHWRSISGW